MQIVNKVLAYVLTTKVWRRVASTLIAHGTFRIYGYPKFDLSKYFDVVKVLEANPEKVYAFTCADTKSLAWKVINLISKSRFGHAGIVELDSSGHAYALHMKGDGLNRWHLLTLLKECDTFALIELPIADVERFRHRVKNLRLLAGNNQIDYDYQLELTEDLPNLLDLPKANLSTSSFKIYCSEIVYLLGKDLVNDPDFVPKWTRDRHSFEPDNVYASGTVALEA